MRFGYVLALLTISLAHVSYIPALRPLSVVLGAVTGALLLGERNGHIISSVIMFA